MGLLDGDDTTRAVDSGDDDQDEEPTPTREASAGATGSLSGSFSVQAGARGSTVTVDGDDVTIDRPDTKQPDSKSGGWLTAYDQYGVPRGTEAAKARQIVKTAAMQTIANGVSDQLVGGELAFLDNDDVMGELSDSEKDAVERFKVVLRDVLTGPHMNGETLDDIVIAAVEDILGPGEGYIQFLRGERTSLPVVSLTNLDPLTIRRNVDEHGYPEDPPFYQAVGAFGGNSVSTMSDVDPVPLQENDVASLRFPKGHRSYRTYPISAAMQVKEWLEILSDSATHHKRYYDDNSVPPGLMQVINASDQTIQDVKNQVEQAAGDPRDFPIVGGEGGAQWIEMGGTSINLNIIEEQKWFFQMCLSAVGLNKAELSMIEEVNYSNGQIQADMVYKKVGQAFGKKFERVFLQVARQFDVFNELGEPFTPTLANSDPRAEQARQEQLRKDYEAGRITLNQYINRSTDGELQLDPGENMVEIGGTVVNYGDHPKWVAQRLLSAAGATDPDAAPDEETPPAEGE